ncbi:MAG: matrixin family metalloprotease [Candidatus Eisenbacteria bacterium]
MSLNGHRSVVLTFGGAALLSMLLFVTFLAPRSSTDSYGKSPTLGDLMSSQDPFDKIACEVTVMALAGQVAERKDVEYGPVAFCLHPDTSPEDAERILRELPTYAPGAGLLGYYRRDRWNYTVMDGNTGVIGEPITITWGVVPDGTWADGGSSNLVSVFTAAWGGDGWMTKIRNAFDRWSVVAGITYIEVSDDGANMPDNQGSLGVRGDVRIGGRSIDGPSNVLAYNYYPDGGDMVLDTDDVDFYHNPANNYGNLKNVVMHEHGHGFGLGHCTPNDCTKLMEAYQCGSGAFVGAQDDDVRGGMRNYGDSYEENDTNLEPTDLGTITDTTIVEDLSLDAGENDFDWYLVTLTNTSITVEVDPIGSTYLLGREGGADPTWMTTDSIADPDIELYNAAGTTLLTSATSGGMQDTEVLNYTVPSVGSYQIRVYGKAGTGTNVQRYTMTIYSDPGSGVPVADPDGLPRTGLAFSVYPNPFSTDARARFMAPVAGPYTVEVFDVTGRLARVIDGHAASSGSVEVVWDGRDSRGNEAASGIYFLRARSGDRTEVKQALLVR